MMSASCCFRLLVMSIIILLEIGFALMGQALEDSCKNLCGGSPGSFVCQAASLLFVDFPCDVPSGVEECLPSLQSECLLSQL